jgi:hypothetical protein
MEKRHVWDLFGEKGVFLKKTTLGDHQPKSVFSAAWFFLWDFG